MSMPIAIEIVGADADAFDRAFGYLAQVEERFSPFKETSEVSQINRGVIALSDASADLREVLNIAQRTREETNGYFDIRRPDGQLDPSGIVKGWAILQAARLIEERGFTRYVVNAGGDIASRGEDDEGREWRFGIRNPFVKNEIVKVVVPRGKGIATSGSYERGDHIYNPHAPGEPLRDVVSLTVIGPDVLEADRFATAAFAMGERGIAFIESLRGFEGYQIGADGTATYTSGFAGYAA